MKHPSCHILPDLYSNMYMCNLWHHEQLKVTMKLSCTMGPNNNLSAIIMTEPYIMWASFSPKPLPLIEILWWPYMYMQNNKAKVLTHRNPFQLLSLHLAHYSKEVRTLVVRIFKQVIINWMSDGFVRLTASSHCPLPSPHLHRRRLSMTVSIDSHIIQPLNGSIVLPGWSV